MFVSRTKSRSGKNSRIEGFWGCKGGRSEKRSVKEKKTDRLEKPVLGDRVGGKYNEKLRQLQGK